jgi:hypothetical protein
MADRRDPAVIAEELNDLRRYLNGLPKQLVDTGAFVAYHKREVLLHEELIAATLYHVMGKSQVRFDPSEGMKSQVATMFQSLSEFEESLRRRSVIGRLLPGILHSIALLGSTGASVFIIQSWDTSAFVSSLVAALVTLAYSYLALRESFFEHRFLRRELESVRWRLEKYVELDQNTGPEGKWQREVIMALIGELADARTKQLTNP